jgi:hypothetical protein
LRRWARFDFLDLSGGSVATLVFWHRFVPKRKGWSLEEIIVHWYRFR